MRGPTTLLISSLALFGAAAFAHPEHEDRLRNAKVLPADTPKEEVTALMKHFAQSLGVRCSYCHVGEEGAPLSTYDFASDEKWQKDKAREMLKMVQGINAHHFTEEGEEAMLLPIEDNEVTCYTCHRGSTEPVAAVPKKSD